MNNGKVRSRDEIIACFKDGQTIAIGGQGGVYYAWNLIDMLEESGVKHLTIYSIDSANPGQAIGQLVRKGQVDRMVTTHIGMNKDTQKLLAEGKIEVELCPMGNFMERIRCGGAGLGGVLTKTGLGTVVAEGKQIITVNGEEYLLEEALHADIALTRARRADPLGNLAYHGCGMASHPVIATCADLSIVQCDLYCDLGEISPDDVRVPGMYVDMLYTGDYESNNIKGRIAMERGL